MNAIQNMSSSELRAYARSRSNGFRYATIFDVSNYGGTGITRTELIVSNVAKRSHQRGAETWTVRAMFYNGEFHSGEVRLMPMSALEPTPEQKADAMIGKIRETVKGWDVVEV